MKRGIVLGLAIVLLVTCQKIPQRYTQTSDEIELSKALIKDYNNKNWTKLVSYYTDSSKIFYNSTKSMSSEKIPAFHQKNESSFLERGFFEEGQEYEMVVTDKGETWVNFWGTWRGTLTVNGELIEIPVHITSQYKNGKIIKEYGYWDNAPILIAIQKSEIAEMQEIEIVSSVE